jgi:hypothetical protein
MDNKKTGWCGISWLLLTHSRDKEWAFWKMVKRTLRLHNYGKFNDPIGFSRKFSSMGLIA